MTFLLCDPGWYVHKTDVQNKWDDNTAEQGTEHFLEKWIAEEEARAGLRHAVVCPNVTGRTKERIAQSKRACAGSLALVDQPQVARTCILRVFGLQMPLRLPLVLHHGLDFLHLVQLIM